MNLLALNWNDLKNPYAGGAEVHLEELLRRLVGFGHTVTLLCSGWSGCLPEETVGGVRIRRYGNRFNFNLIIPRHLRRLARQEQFDILIEDINKIPFYTPWYLNLTRLIVIPHLFAGSVFQEINFVLGSYIYLAEKPLIWAYRGCHFNVISESTAEDISKRGVPPDLLSIVHCGIDRKLYCPTTTPIKYDRPTILYVGRIKKYKSIHHLIDAFAVVKKHIRAARLMIIGSGDYLPTLKQKVASLGLQEDIEFPGFVAQKEKIERMRRSHVAVLPSLKEGWGLTNIEANAVGTAVIAANSPGLRDSVRHDQTGYLYPYGDISILSNYLIEILRNEKTRLRLQQGGLEWAKKFDWDVAARKFETLLLEVVEKNA